MGGTFQMGGPGTTNPPLATALTLRCHLQYSGVPRANSFFNISLKILFSKCHQILKQIVMRSPLGAANLICLLQDAASLKWLRNTELAHGPSCEPRWSRRHANVRNQRKCFPSEKGERQDELVEWEKFGERNHCKQHRVYGDTVITESKQNIPWKGNCVYFHSWKFCFAFSAQVFFTDQNANIINSSEITFFKIFYSVMGYRKQHRVYGDTVIKESKQNIPWKGNCLYFHSWSFLLPSVYKLFLQTKTQIPSIQAKLHFFKSFPV